MILSTVARRRARRRTPPAVITPEPLTHVMWFVDGTLLLFALSWIASSVLRLHHDLYYAVYIWLVLTFLGAYQRLTGSDVLFWIRLRWRLSLFLGTLTSIYLVVNVVRAGATERPGGATLAFEIVWRGIMYGAADSLVRTAFPAAVAFGILRGRILGYPGRLVFAGLTMVLVLAISSAYHLGFEQFRNSQLQSAQLTSVAVATPTLVTANPLGSLTAHVTLHVVTTAYAYESPTFVPPAVDYEPRYVPPGVFGPD